MFSGVPAGELIPPPIIVCNSSVNSPTGLMRGAEGLSDPSGDSFSFTPHSDSFLTPPRTRTTVEACRVALCFPSAASYFLTTDQLCLFRTFSASPMRILSSRVFTATLRGNRTSSDSLARMSLNLGCPPGMPRQICPIRILGYRALLTPGKSRYRPYEQRARPTLVKHSMVPF